MDFTQENYNQIEAAWQDLYSEVVKRVTEPEERQIVCRAFEFANEAHKGVRRRSHEPYIMHPSAVAKIVVCEIGPGHKSIAAALLHDVVEDTDFTVEDISRIFGAKIASLVDGLTKIKGAMVAGSDAKSLQAENFKRILLTLNDDMRIVLIKLADRLHNIRTIGSMPEYKMDKILSETMYVFIPLAQRLGLFSIKTEMENICFKTKSPDLFDKISRQIDDRVCCSESAMHLFIENITNVVKSLGFNDFEITTRTKTPFSVWKKIEHKKVPFEEIFDILGVRIIFKPTDAGTERHQCWKILTAISDIYQMNTSRLRDWVNNPKPNGYEALHMTVMSKEGLGWVEIQIRTQRMHDVAERGIAAHWNYKRIQDGGKGSTDKDIDQWLDKLRYMLASPDTDAIEFLDNFHNELANKDIYIFTPKGESRTTPQGSTALDFAFEVHTNIGLHAIAAKINSKLCPLNQVLQNGDQVEIITAESASPSTEWLNFLVTSTARNATFEALKDEIADAAGTGQKMLEEELAKYNVKLHSKVINKLMIHFSLHNKEQLYTRIATGVVSLDNLGDILRSNKKDKKVSFWKFKLFSKSDSKDIDNDLNEDEDSSDIHVSDDEVKNFLLRHKLSREREVILSSRTDKSNITYRIADCCYPIPGDTIVGFIGQGNEVVIHKKNCPVAEKLAATHGGQIVNAKWDKGIDNSFLTRVKLLGLDRMGILSEVSRYTTTVMSINLRKIFIETHDNIFEGYFDCYVRSLDDLEALMKELRNIKGMENVTRVELTQDEN